MVPEPSVDELDVRNIIQALEKCLESASKMSIREMLDPSASVFKSTVPVLIEAKAWVERSGLASHEFAGESLIQAAADKSGVIAGDFFKVVRAAANELVGAYAASASRAGRAVSFAERWPCEIPGLTVPYDADVGFEIGEPEEVDGHNASEFDPAAAAEALRLMAEKAPGVAVSQGTLHPKSSLVQSAADLLRATNEWLDHNRTRPFEVRAGERVLRALEEGTTIFCDSFVLALRETATELGCVEGLARVPPFKFPPENSGGGQS